MIKLVDNTNEQDFIDFCHTDNIYGTMQYTRYLCYKDYPNTASFWIAYNNDKVMGSISNLYGSVIISFVNDEDSILEIAEFTNHIDVSDLWCDTLFLIFYTEECASFFKVTEKTMTTASTMTATDSGKLSTRVISVNNNLKEVFEVICKGYNLIFDNDNYNTWLSNITVKINRANTRIFAITQDEKIVCIGIIGYQHNNAGEISSIVTLPEYRSKGFAKEMTAHLTAVLSEEGKQPFLFCENERLVHLYEPLGFIRVGRWVRLS